MPPQDTNGDLSEFVISSTEIASFVYGTKPLRIWESIRNKSNARLWQFRYEPQFDEAIEFSEGLARIRIERGYGFIDRKGVLRIRPRFNSVTPFRGAAALASMEGYDGYIDKKGEFIRRWP
jgi:hypothetical protein